MHIHFKPNSSDMIEILDAKALLLGSALGIETTHLVAKNPETKFLNEAWNPTQLLNLPKVVYSRNHVKIKIIQLNRTTQR